MVVHHRTPDSASVVRNVGKHHRTPDSASVVRNVGKHHRTPDSASVVRNVGKHHRTPDSASVVRNVGKFSSQHLGQNGESTTVCLSKRRLQDHSTFCSKT